MKTKIQNYYTQYFTQKIIEKQFIFLNIENHTKFNKTII